MLRPAPLLRAEAATMHLESGCFERSDWGALDVLSVGTFRAIHEVKIDIFSLVQSLVTLPQD